MTRMLNCATCGVAFEYFGVGRPGKYCTEHAPAKNRGEAKRADNLRTRYGITLEQYQLLLDAQGGVCYTCQRPPRPGRNLAVDHSHKYGFIRGLLCMVCNRHLISRHNNPEIMERAAQYLRKPPGRAVLPGQRVAPTKPNGRPWDEWPGDEP